MIEADAFLAAFAIQILSVSVLNPASYVRYVRRWASEFGSERYAQLFNGVEYGKAIERFVTRFSAANLVITGLGALLLVWLLSLTRHPQWVDVVTKLTVIYFLLQMSPLMLIGLYGILKYKTLLNSVQNGKRTVILERRSLFDFVAPIAVILAVLSYLLFVVLVLYLDLHVHQHPSPSRYWYGMVGALTLSYAVNAVVIYRMLYGRSNPLVTHDGRAHSITRAVKGSVYSCIATAWFLALLSMLSQLQLQTWAPFALSLFFVITAMLGLVETKRATAMV